MITLGLTGSIGMGKSTVAQMFIDAGVPVFDADAAVHLVEGPGGSAVAAIEAEFPGATGPHGVDRAKLRAVVMADPDAFSRLERIVHPAVAEERVSFLATHYEQPLVVLDVPLLFETGGWKSVDKVAVVSAPLEIQRERVLARPGMTAERFDTILSRQMPDAEKRARADYVIDTGADLDATRAQVVALIACLRDPAGG